ncbi:Sodium/hydrogen exchanger family-domain-containing protein [Gigaspora rosea]|uniref:Sodium/hydrogen exchanger family-domain-containing protein n=1 Tax=Gigaspora rosea TaxID=44941 RepID=A0A397UMQ6_9GLOM|nr:Sodium/hydrogen exchanger family-domain-containing protein [Gigaspora rosea]
MANEQSSVVSGHKPTDVNPDDPLTLVIIQIVLIVIFTRVINVALSRLRQPRVISEVIGGIILGPSVLGHIPGYMNFIFPAQSLTYLNLLANLGLILFLFIIGVELNPKMLISNAKTALTISAAGICLPFILGVGVSYGLYQTFNNDSGVPFYSFMLFICVAMSITAFPVLARILSELKLLRTPVGITAITSAVGDDIAAWVLLALVVSIINATSSLSALYTFLLCAAWTLFVGFAIRPILAILILRTGSNDFGGPSVTMVAITLSLVLISAFVTNIIGVHYIFGAFIMGVIVPHESGFAIGITEKIEDLVSVLFLPIYFALSGLKTQLGLLDDFRIWGWLILVICVDMFGKITGATIASRLNKLAWRESLTIGVFMSCKGLVELIVLNIGFDARVINDRVFAIMVTVALIITFTTTPLAMWLYPKEYRRMMERIRDGQVTTSIEPAPGTPWKESRASDDTLIDLSKNKRLLVVLNKIEWLPGMMMLVQLLQPFPLYSKPIIPSPRNSVVIPERSTRPVTESNNNNPIVVHALRLVELTQRISAVMKFNETEETLLHDPIMNVFRMFGQLNFVNIKANLTVVAFHDFVKEVVENTRKTSSDLVIIPWDGAGAVMHDESFEGIIGPRGKLLKARERKETSPQISNFVQGVFNEVHTNVGSFVDRGFGVKTSQQGVTQNLTIHVFLPFFGSIDDREALIFVIKLLEHPHIMVSVVRIMTDDNQTNVQEGMQPIQERIERIQESAVATDSNSGTDDNDGSHKFPKRPTLAHTVSTSSVQVLTQGDKKEPDTVDSSILSYYFSLKNGLLSNNDRVSYTEVATTTPLSTAIRLAKEKVNNGKDLIVLGRRRTTPSVYKDEFLKLGKSYGSETRKCLGIAAEAFMVSEVEASILVLQGKNDVRKTVAI